MRIALPHKRASVWVGCIGVDLRGPPLRRIFL